MAPPIGIHSSHRIDIIDHPLEEETLISCHSFGLLSPSWSVSLSTADLHRSQRNRSELRRGGLFSQLSDALEILVKLSPSSSDFKDPVTASEGVDKNFMTSLMAQG